MLCVHKGVMCPCFQAQFSIAALHRRFHHSNKQRTTSATATVFVGCAHGDVAVSGLDG
jgi:hypothetical protein